MRKLRQNSIINLFYSFLLSAKWQNCSRSEKRACGYHSLVGVEISEGWFPFTTIPEGSFAVWDFNNFEVKSIWRWFEVNFLNLHSAALARGKTTPSKERRQLPSVGFYLSLFCVLPISIIHEWMEKFVHLAEDFNCEFSASRMSFSTRVKEDEEIRMKIFQTNN